MSVKITLTSAELLQGAIVGVMRYVQNVKRGSVDRKGAETAKNGWQVHITGAVGELVVAKHFGKFWSGSIGNTKAADVGNLQIRTAFAGGRTAPHLILHADDDSDAPYFLVSGSGLDYEIYGWIMGRHGKAPQFWGDPFGTGRPAYWVPASALHAVDAWGRHAREATTE